MIYYLEEELSELLVKIKRERVSLQEGYDLYFKAQQKYLMVDEEARTQEMSRLTLKIFFQAGKISEEFIKKWQNGKISPTDKELELLKKGCREVLAAFDNHFKKELLSYQKKPYDAHYAEVKEKIRKIRGLIYK